MVTQERLRAEWKAIYRGWQKGGCPKDQDSPVLRLAKKHKISCQEVKRILDRPDHWGAQGKPLFLRYDGRHETP